MDTDMGKGFAEASFPNCSVVILMHLCFVLIHGCRRLNARRLCQNLL